jgi:hypothetical protein
MRREKHPDELGYIHGVGSVDDAPAPRFEIQAEQDAPTKTTHGMPDHVVDQIIAAVEAEDAVDPNELDQRRYEMERAMTSAEKDRLLAEMADVICRVIDAVRFSADDKETLCIVTARMIAKHPGVGMDAACLMSARFRKTGCYSITPTKAEVLAFKP